MFADLQKYHPQQLIMQQFDEDPLVPLFQCRSCEVSRPGLSIGLTLTRKSMLSLGLDQSNCTGTCHVLTLIELHDMIKIVTGVYYQTKINTAVQSSSQMI